MPLLPFEDQPETADSPLSYYLRHYLELVDWTGRAVQDDKRGAIPAELEPILDRLGFDKVSWLEGIKLFERLMFKMTGPADRIRQAAQTSQRSWYRGVNACQAVFGPPQIPTYDFRIISPGSEVDTRFNYEISTG